MCKVTINGKTYLGNNEDSWRLGSKIWFETAKQGKLGAVYVGYGNNFPQGGMNEAGLAFDGLTTFPKPLHFNPMKKNIISPLDFLKELMQTCKTIEDVRQFAIQYNRQPAFNNGEYFFADKAGNYLVMEPDTMIIGKEDKYIIANFCPSITPEKDRFNWARYSRGNQYILNHLTDTSENYCLALTDTMHECRDKFGDGTLYSFIADLDKGNFTLYFYHDFTHELKFKLKNELEKGDHMAEIPALFPPNHEFRKLFNYKTPQNSVFILAFLYLCAASFLFSSVYFLISSFIRKNTTALKKTSQNAKLAIIILNMLLLYYFFVLVNNQILFYFPAPYYDARFTLLNIAAYIPFVLILFIIPLTRMNTFIFKDPSWHIFSKFLFTFNNIVYLILICLFTYWGLYSVF